MTERSVPKTMITLPRTTVRALAAMPDGGPARHRIAALRQAGFDGGEEMAAAFADTVLDESGSQPDELPLDQFNERVAQFFERAGWGRLAMSSIHDVVAAVDVTDCWEARMHGSSSGPCCHLTTGLLSAFFSRFAPYTLATMEVECAATGTPAQPQCRFLLGELETLNELYARIAQGEDYTAALAQLSGASASA